jgi:hypothetical protein
MSRTFRHPRLRSRHLRTDTEPARKRSALTLTAGTTVDALTETEWARRSSSKPLIFPAGVRGLPGGRQKGGGTNAIGRVHLAASHSAGAIRRRRFVVPLTGGSRVTHNVLRRWSIGRKGAPPNEAELLAWASLPAISRSSAVNPKQGQHAQDESPDTLGDLLYADRSRTTVPEDDWVSLVHVGWIMTPVRSRAVDRLRFEQRKKRVPRHPSEREPEEVDRPADAVEARRRRGSLPGALTALTAGERQAIETAFKVLESEGGRS